jgi:hypothetical protein
MDAARIVDELTHYDRLPESALRAASAHRDLLLPEFLSLIERCAAGEADGEEDGLLLVFHLLGEWRETSAYRPLLAFLRRPPEELDIVLGDAITTTCPRVIAAVFDGDPRPLFDLILDPAADEFVRSGMCEVLAMVAVRGAMPRAEAARFLDEAQARLEAERGNYVWNGWQSAIAMLGLSELAPRVKDAFDRKMIDPMWLAYRHFEEDLAYALAHPEAPHEKWDRDYSLFGDTVAELSRWYGFSEQYRADRRRWERQAALMEQTSRPAVDPWTPLRNPARSVGRNDPCPCGSGLKYKRCCLNAARTV